MAEKSLDEFGTDPRGRLGRVARCYVCERERSAERRKTDQYKERTNSWARKARAERPELREKHRQYAAQYRANNPDKVQASLNKWRRENVAQTRAYNATQRAARRKAVPPWVGKAHLDKIAELHVAARQLEESTGLPHAVDHIVPLKNKLVCGLHVWWNLRVIPDSENARKKNRFDLTLYPEQGEMADTKEPENAV